MGRQVAIISAGFAQHAARRPDVSMPELVGEAISDCLSKVPSVEIGDIDAIVNGNMPAFEGTNVPELWMTDAIGARNKPLMRVTTGGTTGASVAITAYYHIAAGLPGIDTVLAIGFEQQSQGNTKLGLSSVSFGEITVNLELGIPLERLIQTYISGPAVGAVSFQSQSYMHKSGITEEDLARVVVQNRHNGAKTWWTHLKMPDYSIEKVLATPYISVPLRFGMVCPASDGACAMLLTTEEKAKEWCDIPVYVNGVSSISHETAIRGYCGSGAGQLDSSEQEEAKFGAKIAYKQAGITFPSKEIDYIEVYAPFPNQELMWLERLGIFEENTAAEKYKTGVTTPNGELPVNCSGGVSCTNAIGASALERPAVAALQIMGKASNQVPNTIHTAVGHGWGGVLNFCAIMAMADEPKRKFK